jgi:hypothetical protein
MRILVTGSRGWKDAIKILATLTEFDKMLNHGPGCDCPTPELIHGGARGADEIAGRAASRLKWKVRVVRADWDKHGKAAGAIRNNEMLDMKPDAVIAFWDGKSSGTKQCFEEAQKRGIPVTLVT